MIESLEGRIIMDFVITAEHGSKTVLSYLRSVAKISAGTVSQLKKTPMGITVNNSHVTVRYILKENDVLSIRIQDSDERISENVIPVKLPVEIIYEDEHVMALNKPPFMPTHPSHKHFDDTLGNAVAYIYKERSLPFVFRPLGRLDANTSGVVVLSKSRAVASFYFAEAQKNNIAKHYIAILDGEMELPTYAEDGRTHVIDKPIKRTGESIITREVANDGDDGAASAKTAYRLLYSGNGISIVDASPITGRTHQLRVHFAHLGFPIINDGLYGKNKTDSERHLLHAISLNLLAPFSERRLLLHAEPPTDMLEFVKSKTGKELSEIIGSHDLSENLSYI